MTLLEDRVDDHVADEQRVEIIPGRSAADRTFRGLLACSAAMVFILLVSIMVFLLFHGWWALSHYKLAFFTGTTWSTKPGVLGLLVGSVEIALVAVVVALPVALATALMINEFAPHRLRPWLTGLIDLLATVPSIVYGFWGLEALTTFAKGPAAWLGTYLDFIPIFRTNEPGNYEDSIFICGLIVSIMITPVITALSREVMSQTPRDACEAALALGGTRWGMITDVVLPFSRSGIVGGTLLGLSRAMGETIVVLLVLSSSNKASLAILGPGGSGSIAKQIAGFFTTSNAHERSALTLAGLTLFATTLVFSLGGRYIARGAGGSSQ